MLYDTRAQDTEHAAKVKMQCAEDIHSLAKAMGGSNFQAKIDELVSKMDEAEGRGKWIKGKWVIPTGKKPLSMYDAELWQKAFPNLFPYGDGVFGLKKRKTPMTFGQWAWMLLLRTNWSMMYLQHLARNAKRVLLRRSPLNLVLLVLRTQAASVLLVPSESEAMNLARSVRMQSSTICPQHNHAGLLI